VRGYWVVFLLILLFPLCGYAQEETLKTAIVNKLRHQEGLLRSAEFTYDCVVSATSADMAALLRKNSTPDWDLIKQYLVDENKARASSYTAHWWRKGTKERLEIKFKNGTAKTFAYDGNVSRRVERGRDGVQGVLEPRQGATWLRWHREEPFALLFQCGDMPYSEMIAKGIEEKTKVLDAAEKRHFEIFCRIAEKTNGYFAFVFDKDGRMSERRGYVKHTKDQLSMDRQYIFTDYSGYLDETGETVWFPKNAVIRFYTDPGKGAPIVYETETLHFSEIKFNVPIADEHFVLEFPKEGKVLDRLTKRGWLSQEEAPTYWASPPLPRSRGSWLWLIGGGLATLTIVWGGYKYWRSRRPAVVKKAV
jgi:hypothetical protein